MDSRGIDKQGDLVFLAMGSAGLTIMDVSNPTAPLITGSCNGLGFAKSVVVVEDYAYVVSSNGFHIIDIANPQIPALSGSYPSGGEGLAIDGNYAYIGVGYYGLLILNIASPDSIFQVSITSTGGGSAIGLEKRDSLVYIANNYDFVILNVNDPSNPVEVGRCDTPNYTRDVALSGDFAFTAQGPNAMQVIDISDPANPQICGYHSTCGWTWRLTAEGEYAYLADWTYFGIYDCSEAMGGLPAPVVLISLVEEGVLLSWEALSGAEYYSIYTGDNPYLTISEMTLVSSTAGTEFLIETPIIGAKFYRVIAGDN